MAATHEDFAPKEPIEGSSDRAFGLTLSVVLSIYGLSPLLRAGEARPWALIAAASFLALAVVRPRWLGPLNRVWTKLGLLLASVVNPIVMALLFFFTITPIALLMRALGKDGLARRFDARASSYWIERKPPGPSPESMRRQF